MPFESTLALCLRCDVRSLDVGAGSTATTLVVADGHGGHATGWVPARLAVRTLCEQTRQPAETPRYIGAADDLPDAWGWSGCEQDRRAADLVYTACARQISPTTTLDAAMLDLDRTFHRIHELPHRIHSPLASCTAVRLDSDHHVHGAHTGVGRALVLRVEPLFSDEPLEPLTMEHYLHEVIRRRPNDPMFKTIVGDIPQQIIVSGLGALDIPQPLAGLDTFKVHLAPGDALLLSSSRLPLPDAALTELLRRAHDLTTPLADVLQTIITACLATAEPRLEISLALLRRTA